MDPRPITGKLGPKQQEALDGPNADMKLFTCATCKQKYVDMALYFYGRISTKCLWCTKFPDRQTSKS
jgi:hypothetical protein